jgi:hypothetical protein
MNPSKAMFVFWSVLLVVGFAYFITLGALHR